MSLKNCKACNKEIGEKVAKCPNCGTDQRNWFMQHKIITGILALFLIGVVGSAMEGSDSVPTIEGVKPVTSTAIEDKSEPSKPVEKGFKEGMYKVGADLAAGEYYLTADNGSAYFQVTKDSSGEFESIITNDNFSTNRYITVKDGQYIDMKGCTAYKPEDAPKLKAENNTYPEGMYKIGTDIPAGEYKINAEDMGYCEVSTSSTGNMESIVTNDNFSGEKYITIKDGQYLKLVHVELTIK